MDGLGVSRILARSWQVYRSRLGVFMAISVASALFAAGVILLAGRTLLDVRSDFDVLVAYGAIGLALIGIFVVELILLLVYIQVAFGQIAGLNWSGIALVRSVSLSPLPRIAGLTLCYAAPGIFAALVTAPFGGLDTLLTISLPLGVVYLPLTVLWMLAPAVVVGENSRALTSLGRSWRLVSSRFWTVLLTALIPGFVVTLPRMIVPQIPDLFWTAFDAIVLPPFLAVLTTVLFVDLNRHAGRLSLDVMVSRLFRPLT